MSLAGKELSISFAKTKTKVKTSLKHNQRRFDENDMPENVDKSRLHLNKHIVNSTPRDEYKVVFGDALKEYNDKQKRSDRKIDDYYTHTINKAGKTKPYEEFIIGLGKESDWDELSEEDFIEGVEIVHEMTMAFIENNPNMHVISADVHGDESSPHAHIVAIPLGDGYKRGLSKQPSMSKMMEQQGYTRNGFTEWREAQVDALEPSLRSRGISRKVVGTNGYQDLEDYKSAMHEIDDTQERMQREHERIVAEKERELQEKQREIDRQKNVIKNQTEYNEQAKFNAERDQEEFSNRFARFMAVLGTLRVSEQLKTGLKRFVETGSTGLVHKGTEDQVSPDEVMGLVNKKVSKIPEKDVINAMAQVEEEDELEF